jgi:hypothetical protein
MQISASAAETRRLHDTLRDFAREHGCAEVRLDHCLTCAPIARLALSGLDASWLPAGEKAKKRQEFVAELDRLDAALARLDGSIDLSLLRSRQD